MISFGLLAFGQLGNPPTESDRARNWFSLRMRVRLAGSLVDRKLNYDYAITGYGNRSLPPWMLNMQCVVHVAKLGDR